MKSPREAAFDNLYNEGGDGFNPYRGEATPRADAHASIVENGRLLIYKGLPHHESVLNAKLADAERRLERATDAFGRQIIEASIAELRAAIDG